MRIVVCAPKFSGLSFFSSTWSSGSGNLSTLYSVFSILINNRGYMAYSILKIKYITIGLTTQTAYCNKKNIGVIENRLYLINTG